MYWIYNIFLTWLVWMHVSTQCSQLILVNRWHTNTLLHVVTQGPFSVLSEPLKCPESCLLLNLLHPEINPYPANGRIWWAHNNASKWQMGFNSAFKELKWGWIIDGTVILRIGYINGRATPVLASHKSNSSSVPRGIVDSYSTLPWVT